MRDRKPPPLLLERVAVKKVRRPTRSSLVCRVTWSMGSDTVRCCLRWGHAGPHQSAAK